MLRMQQPQRLAPNRQRSDHHGHRKTEPLRPLLRRTGQHARGNGHARTRKPAEGKCQPLHEAHPSGLPHGHVAARSPREAAHRALARRSRLLAILLQQPGNQDQDARACQRRGDQIEPPEQVLNHRLRLALEQRMLDHFDQPFADDPRQKQSPRPRRIANRLNASAPAKYALHPLLPEVRNHGKHRAGMQHHQQQRHLRRRWDPAPSAFRRPQRGQSLKPAATQPVPAQWPAQSLDKLSMPLF